MRESSYQPLGIILKPNEFGQYPIGALTRADNLVMREPGNLSQLNKRDTLGDTPWDTLPGFYFAMLYNTSATLLVMVYSWDGIGDGVWVPYWYASSAYQLAPYEDETTTFTWFGPNTADFNLFQQPWLVPVTFRERTILTSDQGVLVGDYMEPEVAFPEQLLLRHAGLPQPFVWGFDYAAGNAVEDEEVVTYAVTLERHYEDVPGYILISEPSPFVRVKSNGSHGYEMTVSWGGGNPTDQGMAGVREGDLVKIWRSMPAESTAPSENVDSGTTLYLAKTYELTSSDITAQQVTLEDSAPPTSLYEELYTNPGQQTLQSIRRRPPQAQCVAYYQGATFYGNVKTPAQWRARMPNGNGALDLTGDAVVRERGIGVRLINSGTYGSGSATITGVSAADYVGLAVGQRLGGAAFADGLSIADLPGGGVITMSGPAVGPGGPTTSLISIDVVTIDGVDYPIDDLFGFTWALGEGGHSPGYRFYNLIADNTIAYREQLGLPYAVLADLQLVFNQGFALEPTRFAQATNTMQVSATNGANYDPPVAEYGTTPTDFRPHPEPNRLYWSWDQQPECVAPGNSTPVGAGEIIALAQVRDSLMVFCTDGIYRLTGNLTRTSGIGANWRVDVVDRTFVLSWPNAFCILRDRCYAVGNLGLVEVTDSGCIRISESIIDISSTGPVVGLTTPNEVWTKLNGDGWLIYSVEQKVFTKLVAEDAIDDTVATQSPFLGQGYINIGGREYDVFNLGSDDIAEGTADYQPVFAKDPASAKQWIDMTIICSAASAGRTVTPRFNGTTWSSAEAALLNRQNDSRRNFQVPRNAPAIGSTLTPGIVFNEDVAPAVKISLRGISLRFQELSEQQVFR